MIGTTISHYKILEKLGEGGMGVVYKAEDNKLKRMVALKFLPPQALASENEKTRFNREAQAAAALNHPHIATIHEIDEVDGQSFIAMEYVDGLSLEEEIARGPLKLDKAIGIAIQIVDGMNSAHKNGVIHRDVKPANIMFTNNGEAKIMDFGLAKLTGRTKLTKTEMILGTAAYMSPEQAQGTRVDHRSDIFSLGVVLYEMVTGEHPFKGDYEQAVVYSIVNEEPEPITALRSRVPRELKRIVNKALAKSPDKRYQHLDEMLVDLLTLRESLKFFKSKSNSTIETSPNRKRTYLYVGVASVLILLIAVSFFFKDRSVSTVIDSIAVLPLDNFSGDSKQEYFADGMTEALITDLAQIGALRVISRTSVMPYKGSRKSLREIAQELNVDAIVEGSVFQDGMRVRITAQLIEAATDRHLWARSYERDLRNILALHSEVAQAIAREINIALTTDEEMRLATARPVDPEAHEAFLKGQYHLQKHQNIDISVNQLRSSIEYFQQAIELDPDWASAHAGLADAYHWLASSGRGFGGEFYPKSKAEALKALTLDESLAQAHSSLAFVLHNYDWDWVAAAREYKRANELSPNSHAWGIAIFFLSAGRYEEAIKWYKRAEERNPLSVQLKAQLGHAYTCAGQYDRAIQYLRNTLELNPNQADARYYLADTYLRTGMYEEAIAESQKAVATGSGYPGFLAQLGYAYALTGRRGEALKVLNQLEKGSGDHFSNKLVELYIALGKKDEALALLQNAFEKRSDDLLYIRCSTVSDSLRDHPSFQQILRAINFPEGDIQFETRK